MDPITTDELTLRESLTTGELRLFLLDYRNAVVAIARGHDQAAIARYTREATESGRAVFESLVGREPETEELESLLALGLLEEQCQRHRP